MIILAPDQAAASLPQAENRPGQRVLLKDIPASLGQVVLPEANLRQVRGLKWQAGRDNQVNPAIVEVHPFPEAIRPQQD